MNHELSIFVDESGDWGEYDYHAPYYIVSFVIHTQSIDISSELNRLDNAMNNLGFSNHCIHAGPIIRGEVEYREIDKQTRQKILKSLMSFTRNADIKIKAFLH